MIKCIAKYPNPKNFPICKIIFDDDYTVIMYGMYKSKDEYSMGMRWSKSESILGYPNIFGKSMWMVIPEDIDRYIVEGLIRDYGDSENKSFCKKAAMEFIEIYNNNYRVIK